MLTALQGAAGFGDASCLMTVGARLFGTVLVTALPLVIALRTGATFGRIEVPHRLLLALCVVIACTLSLPTADTAVVLWVQCQAPSWTDTLVPLADALLRGLTLGLLIRSTLTIVETVASALEGHLQLSNESARGGSFTLLALSLWAFRWWQNLSIVDFLGPNEMPAGAWLLYTVDSLVDALTTGFALAACALLCLIFGEIALGLLQRVLPNISAWQFSLPLRLFLGLQIIGVLLRSPLFGAAG